MNEVNRVKGGGGGGERGGVQFLFVKQARFRKMKFRNYLARRVVRCLKLEVKF